MVLGIPNEVDIPDIALFIGSSKLRSYSDHIEKILSMIYNYKSKFYFISSLLHSNQEKKKMHPLLFVCNIKKTNVSLNSK